MQAANGFKSAGSYNFTYPICDKFDCTLCSTTDGCISVIAGRISNNTLNTLKPDYAL